MIGPLPVEVFVDATRCKLVLRPMGKKYDVSFHVDDPTRALLELAPEPPIESKPVTGPVCAADDCEKPIIQTRKNVKKYCSEECRARMYRRRTRK